MTNYNEEIHALHYRQEMQAREDFKLREELAMAGSESARQQNEEDWDPFYLAHVEEGWDPIRRVSGDEK